MYFYAKSLNNEEDIEDRRHGLDLYERLCHSLFMHMLQTIKLPREKWLKLHTEEMIDGKWWDGNRPPDLEDLREFGIWIYNSNFEINE
jgi:hypothetical protein